ncbi:hypothetical protein D3C76_602690 [compost metagenome]
MLTSKDYYYLYNGHGDVIQIVDTNGNIVNSYTYDEWEISRINLNKSQTHLNILGKYMMNRRGFTIFGLDIMIQKLDGLLMRISMRDRLIIRLV